VWSGIYDAIDHYIASGVIIKPTSRKHKAGVGDLFAMEKEIARLRKEYGIPMI